MQRAWGAPHNKMIKVSCFKNVFQAILNHLDHAFFQLLRGVHQKSMRGQFWNQL